MDEATTARLEQLRRELTDREAQILIDGQWRTAASSETIDVDDPATGERIATIAGGNEADVDVAVSAARRAFREGPWSRTTSWDRAAALGKLADLLDADRESACLLESLDAGHTLESIHRGDFTLALRHLRENAGWATKINGETAMRSGGATALEYYLREPIGVVGIITPWNAPLLMVVQKLAPALAIGCTVVIKPAELAPLSALRIGELCRRAGIPAGVVNIVTGHGAVAGHALAKHPDVNMISFTGSTAVGKSIFAAAGQSNLKRVVLELGGKSPVIVFADADLDKAAKAIAQEVIFKSGQYCAAGTRLFAQRSVRAPLLERMRECMSAVTIGAGYASGNDMGPMISEKQRQRAEHIIGASVDTDSTVFCGGRRRAGRGYFFEPTILSTTTTRTQVMQEEIFAPVISEMPFNDDASLAEIAQLANDTAYGLSAKIWSQNVSAINGLLPLLETGQVIVNGGGGAAMLPFGGVKQSGYGRENALPGILEFTQIKAVRLGY